MKHPLAWLLLLSVAGCAAIPSRSTHPAAALQAQVARELALQAQRDWSLQGRLAVSHDGDGGSGRIEWRQRGSDFEIRLSAPVTRQSWLLRSEGGRARIEGLAGGPRESGDAEGLLFEATGWRIPVAALASWVRGARASPAAPIEFGPGGLPSTLVEQGWQVEYRAWDEQPTPRPLRVFAERGGSRVRLVVEAWGER